MLLINTVPLDCINQAAVQYHVPAVVILSVLKTEGGYTGSAKLNHNGSFDYGPFQINSYWVPKLEQYEIIQKELRYNPCINTKISAWIFSKNIADSDCFQKGVGNNNSLTPYFNKKYFYRVSVNYYKIKKVFYASE